MEIKPTIGSVVGATDETHWGQVLISPQAYGIIEIEDGIGRARERGVAILAKLSRLMEEPPTSLHELEALVGHVMEHVIVTVALLVPVGKVVYVVLQGKGGVYLKRGHHVSCLMKEAGAISGEVQEGDTVLLVSRGFTNVLSENELSQVFDHLPASDAAEKLTLLLHESSGGVGGAGLLFQIQGLLPVEAEEPKVRRTILPRPIFESMTRLAIKRDFSGIKRTLSRRRLAVFSGPVRRILTPLQGKNKLVALISVFLIVSFIVSVVIGIRKQLGSEQNQEVIQVLNEAQRAYEEGVALLDLNPVKGRERLSQAKALLTPIATSLSSKTKLGRQVRTLSQQVNDTLTLAMHVVASEPQLFYDASLLKKDARILGIALSGDTIAGIDPSTKLVFSLILSSKNGQVIAGGDSYQKAALVGIHGGAVYVLTDSGIYRVEIGEKKTTPMIVRKDSQWGDVIAMTAFGGNLYLLDRANSRIWKYVATLQQGFDGELSRTDSGQAGFSELREYLNPDTLPDLSRATGMAIDGSIWVGTSDGKILRFTQGKENTFVAKGVEPSLGSALVVYTSDETTYLYVLDGQRKRVVVIDKDGMYVSQYVWEGGIQPTQLVVSEKLKKILLLADGKLYALELK